ncbi:response regulator [Tabrizicola sp. M-4]|uniref:response regulator n=1 Tax=Tabrizicola sp. M-4 TaxID=3055847 RepID=UPI003DA8408A
MSQFFDEALQETRLARAAVRVRHLILGITFFATLGAMAFVFTKIDQELDRSSSVDSDNVTWTMAQVEVDTLKLQRAVIVADENPGDPEALDDLRLAFDIFYSRFNILSRSDRLIGLPINEALRQELWSEGAFFDRITPVIDSDDAALAAAVPALRDEMETVSDTVRTHVVSSLQSLMEIGDARRGELRRSLQVFAAASLGLLGLMAGLSLVIILQNRAQGQRSATTERAVHNLRATIEASLDAVVITDFRGQVTDCNTAAENLFGRKRDECRTVRMSDMLGSEGDEDPLATLYNKMRTNSPDLQDGRLQMVARHSSGREMQVEVALTEAQGANGGPMFIAFLRDITERLEREENLRKARNDALKGEEAKSRFLAVMSHEMRTPLNGLIAAAELLQTSTELSERQNWLSEIVLSCGWAALDQVNNVLELTRLGSEESASYQVSDFSPVQIMRDLMLQNQPHATKRGNDLRFEEPPEPLPRVHAPRQLFLRVLYNLVGNAIKFTDAGTVTLRLRGERVGDGRQLHMVIDVVDTGIGIAEDDLERIFHNFETLDASYARMREGTGLGLGIAKLSAEAMGGSIHVTSALGKGSTFTFEVTLPLAQEASQSSTARAGGDEEPLALHILVVEDNPINSLLLTEMLRLRGHTVTNAVDGIEAIEKTATTRFDMILTDISMPRMDGVEATRRIRAEGACRDIPIIGVTANASPDKVPEFLAAGMTDVLVKPVTRSALMTIIANHANGSGPKPAEPAPETPAEPSVLNPEVFHETVEEMGREFVERIADRLLTETESLLPQLDAFAQTGSYAEAAKAAHKTAGAAAAIGLAGLHGALARYEKAALANDAATAAQELDAARRILPRTVKELRENGLSLALAGAE